eukprot:scaffold6314_cov273-Ochromonas_danica.AAC.28
MSVIWQLPRDILHSIYSEWLGWKDLSQLDIACVGKTVREIWLSSLTNLRVRGCTGICNETMTNDNNLVPPRSGRKSLKDDDDDNSMNKMKIFYFWLISHQIFCIERFPVKLNILQYLVKGLDLQTYCPTIQTIEITKGGGRRRCCKTSSIISDDDDCYSSNTMMISNNLSVFLSHCRGLQGVIMRLMDQNKHLYEIVLEVLVETLRENSLIIVDLKDCPMDYESHDVIITNLLTKHARSLQELYLHINGGGMDLIVSVLINNEIHLKVLDVTMTNWQLMESSLLPYLSSGTGMLLETLTVVVIDMPSSTIDDAILVSIATSCPKLKRFAILNTLPCSIEKVRLLYEQCPFLQYVSIDGTINTDEENNYIYIGVSSGDDWAVCLSHALRRNQYKQAALSLIEDYHPMGNLKAILESYQLDLGTSASEASLIALLEDLPHLNSLLLSMDDTNNRHSDALLTAIAKYGKNLTQLDLGLTPFDFSDEMFIRLPAGCGVKSLIAVSNHSSLTEISLNVSEEIASEDMLDGFLLDRKVATEKVTTGIYTQAVISSASTSKYQFYYCTTTTATSTSIALQMHLLGRGYKTLFEGEN